MITVVGCGQINTKSTLDYLFNNFFRFGNFPWLFSTACFPDSQIIRQQVHFLDNSRQEQTFFDLFPQDQLSVTIPIRNYGDFCFVLLNWFLLLMLMFLLLIIFAKILSGVFVFVNYKTVRCSVRMC